MSKTFQFCIAASLLSIALGNLAFSVDAGNWLRKGVLAAQGACIGVAVASLFVGAVEN